MENDCFSPFPSKRLPLEIPGVCHPSLVTGSIVCLSFVLFKVCRSKMLETSKTSVLLKHHILGIFFAIFTPILGKMNPF